MNLTKLTLQLLLSVLVVNIFSCAPGEIKKSESVPQTISTPNESSQSVSSSSNAKKYIKEGGWKVPDLNSSRRTLTLSKKVNLNNASVRVLITEFEPTTEILTDEPFKTINLSIELIHINTIRIYSVRGHVFCYRIQADEASKDNKQRTVYGGMLFFFSYYDEDGDGKFESLVLDEVDSSGNNSFYAFPHLPKWLSNVK